MKRLYRSKDDRIIAGVAGGIAEFLSVDPTIIRLLFLASVFFGGAGIVVYIGGALIIPEKGEEKPA